MHIVAMTYPEEPNRETMERYAAFYRSLSFVIPCPACRSEYAKMMKTHPVEQALACRDDIFRWTVNIHNEVSERIGKLPMTPGFVENVYVFDSGRSGVDPEVDRRLSLGIGVYAAIFAITVAACVSAWLLFGRLACAGGARDLE